MGGLDRSAAGTSSSAGPGYGKRNRTTEHHRPDIVPVGASTSVIDTIRPAINAARLYIGNSPETPAPMAQRPPAAGPITAEDAAPEMSYCCTAPDGMRHRLQRPVQSPGAANFTDR